MSSLCDATKRSVVDAWKAVDRANPKAPSFLNLVQFEGVWEHYEQIEREKAKENQKANIKLMKEGYRRQPETGELPDCLVQCPNCGKKIGEVIDGTINPEIIKKMFVRDDAS